MIPLGAAWNGATAGNATRTASSDHLVGRGMNILDAKEVQT